MMENWNNDMGVGVGAGMIAPADGNASGAAYTPNYSAHGEQDQNASAADAGTVNLGTNLERLEEVRPDLVSALRELVLQYRAEGVTARRHEIRRIRQARLFWQGMQYAWWNPNDMNWHLPYEQRANDDASLEEMPRYQFVTNFYQGFGLSFVAVLSQDVPSVRFYPQSAQSLVDIAAARAASDVSELVERNNHVQHLLTSIGYFLWTDGKLGAYVRYVKDGQRFGYRQEDVLEAVQIPLGKDVWVCGECGKEEESGEEYGTETQDPGMRNAPGAPSEKEDSVKPAGQKNCAGCGAELGAKDLRRAERVTVPRVAETRRVANGQEEISIVGGLELNTPVWANEMHEYPYLQWQAEVHREVEGGVPAGGQEN